MNREKDAVNLILCHTTLQMLIAEKIIDKHPDERFYIVLISNIKNGKYDYYFNRLRKKAERGYSFYYIYLDKKGWFTSLLEYKIKGYLLPKIKAIYLASIDRSDIITFISSISKAKIITFDDGTINLISQSIFLGNKEYIREEFLNFFRFISNGLTIKKIRDTSVEHYTIFRDLKNIMDDGRRKITYLPLLDYEDLELNTAGVKNIVKILLGSVEYDLKLPSEKAIDLFGIQYLVLHPRQEYKLGGVINLETDLIIEDYLFQEIKENPNNQYEIYSFFSSALLILKNFPNLKVFALKPEFISDDHWISPVYDLFQESDIPIIKI